MKAIVYEAYGSSDVLELRDVEKPTPNDNEVLIKVHAVEISPADCEIRSFKLPVLWYWLPLRAYIGFRRSRKPRILGFYLAGEIESVGKAVAGFTGGDQVFAASGIRFGACAEYTCLPSTYTIATKPANMSYAEAAAVPLGGLNALHFIRRAKIQSGEKVLVNGGCGTIGTFAVQLAKYFGVEVTGVDSTDKLDVMRSIGADKVIDYTKEDYTRSGETYDVIFDVVAKATMFSRSKKCLKENGRLLLSNPRLSQMFGALWTSATSSKKVIFEFAGEKTEDLKFLKALIEAGNLRSVVDRCYPLEQTAEAHRYVQSGQKKGVVVMTVAHGIENQQR